MSYKITDEDIIYIGYACEVRMYILVYHVKPFTVYMMLCTIEKQQ